MKKPTKSKALVAVKKDKMLSLSPEVLISEGIKNKVSVEVMERLLAMRDKLKAEYAKEQYDKAMSDFQADCPIIKKTKSVKTKSGIVAYSYAPLESILIQTKELIRKHGFSYSIQTDLTDKGVKSTCVVKHVAGHGEPYSVEVPLGNKTDIMSNSQVTASAGTFSKRYAFCNAFGILTGDEDNDGMAENMVSKKTYAQKSDVIVEGEVEPTNNGFDKATKIIKACKNKTVLFDYLDKVSKSKTFTKEQIVQMKALINSKIEEIDNA